MIASESLTFLKKLLDTPGPSGFEAAPAKVWRDYAKKFSKVSGDVAGNSLAEVNGAGKPTIMLAGHIDEIGVIINYAWPSRAFEIVLNFSALGILGMWGMIVLCQLRMRQQVRRGLLPQPEFGMPGAPWTGYLTLAFLVTVVVAMGFSKESDDRWTVASRIDRRLRALPLVPPAPRTFHAVWRRSTPRHRPFADLIEIVRAHGARALTGKPPRTRR